MLSSIDSPRTAFNPTAKEICDVVAAAFPGARISWQTDVKRQAMAAHASQIGETSFFLAMPADAFAASFGWEWFIRQGAAPGTTETALLS